MVSFQDGSECRLDQPNPEVVSILTSDGMLLECDEDETPYFPGASVRAPPNFFRDNATYTKGSPRGAHRTGIVTSVEETNVHVEWLTTRNTNQVISQPVETCSTELVVRLCEHDYTHIQVGDFVLASPDLLSMPKELRSSSVPPLEGTLQGRLEEASGSGVVSDAVMTEGNTALTAFIIEEFFDIPQLSDDSSGEEKRRMARRRARRNRGQVSQDTWNERRARMERLTMQRNRIREGAFLEEEPTASFAIARELIACPVSSGGETSGASALPSIPAPSAVYLMPNSGGGAASQVHRTLFVRQTCTHVDIAWQDGTISHMIPATELYPIDGAQEHDFFPMDIVRESKCRLAGGAQPKYGYVVTVNSADRVCEVRWYEETGASGEPPVVNLTTPTEMVSVYEIECSEGHDFCMGAVVLRLDPMEDHGEVTGPHPASRLLGQVVGLKDGLLEVVWADKHRSSISPFRCLRLVADSDSEDEDEDEDSSSEESASEAEQLQADAGVLRASGEDAFYEDSLSRELNKQDLDKYSLDQEPSVPQPAALPSMMNVPVPGMVIVPPPVPASVAFLETSAPMERVSLPSEEVPRFSMEESPPSRHAFFADQSETPSGSAMRRFQQEIKRLHSDLPDGIWVRCYSSAVHLMRFIIEGPVDTPFNGALFIFDVKIPRSFPNEPPAVFYQSLESTRLNPNLYVDGTVCLSLLGTWTGEQECESWTRTSTLLQVVVSIQGLVLNSKPYFNEAGYEKLRGSSSGEHSAHLYNEASCSTLQEHILHTLSIVCSPGWEDVVDVVTLFYARQAALLLHRMRSIADSQSPDHAVACSQQGLGAEPLSRGFKLLLQRHLSRLEERLAPFVEAGQSLPAEGDLETCKDQEEGCSASEVGGGASASSSTSGARQNRRRGKK